MPIATPAKTKTEEIITIKRLSKTFGRVKALDELDLTIRRGEVHGFLGPNGAGKSTTIRVLLGLLRKDAGTVRLLGGDPWSEAVALHARLSYIPGEVNFWPNLTGGEAIDLLGKLRGGVEKARRDELIERFKLDAAKKFRAYSKGNRQKVAVVAALAADVELYIMDEPTSGLDPLMLATFQDCVRELARAGKTVLLSSHTLAEVEALCDKVTIIREGKTVESGSLKELRHLTHTSIKVTTKRALKGLDKLPGIHNLELSGTHAEFEVEKEALSPILEHLSSLEVLDLISTPPTLGELFLRHYDESPGTETDTQEQG